MLAVVLRNLELRSDTVRARDDDGVLEPSGLEVEEATKATDDRVGPDPLRRLDDRLDPVDELVPGVDRNSRRSVGEALDRLGLLEERAATSRCQFLQVSQKNERRRANR